ncbi:response regulator transcription factor [Agromyces larvae]|uniref:Response regulator transcription factor n=1 Tax=Agromyces larvae TaxID=2929802 RepID=A0ABY4C321_9MICO|nr:response regulator transcription factor [Agromyces larvae]UOE45795.1 response regulator transcription factor [Agromyces larvae]
MSVVRVGVVDDHALFREGVRALLAGEVGMEVVGEAGDAKSGIRLAVVERPTVLLLDVHLPDGSGLDAIHELRRAAPNVAIVMLTMADGDAAVAEALSAGAVGYVLKGADPDELVRAIRAAARGDLLFGPSVADGARRLLQAGSGPWRPPLPELSERERAIADHLAAGRDAPEIADALHLSVKTVRNVLAMLPRRLGVSSREEVVTRARDAGLGR